VNTQIHGSTCLSIARDEFPAISVSGGPIIFVYCLFQQNPCGIEAFGAGEKRDEHIETHSPEDFGLSPTGCIEESDT